MLEGMEEAFQDIVGAINHPDACPGLRVDGDRVRIRAPYRGS